MLANTLEMPEAHQLTTVARGSNQSGMRAHNERLVLSLIRQMGPMAKAEITRLTGLSAQSVSVIMRALEAESLLVKDAPRRGKVGQPSVPMRLDPEGAYFFGLTIGRRSLELVLTDFEGAIIARERKAHDYPLPDGVLSYARATIPKLMSALPPDHGDRVAGLGVAAPFHIWNWSAHLGLDPTVLDVWRDRDIAAELAADWEFPVILANDATAACGAELVFGDQSKPREFLYLHIGFFIGGGLVLDNALFAGPTGNAAAIGSMPVAIDDGGITHLVDVASLVTLERAVVDCSGEAVTNWDAVDEWQIPVEVLDPWMRRAAAALTQAILSAASVIDFGCVVLDGWLPEHMRADLVRLIAARMDEAEISGIAKPIIREGGIGPDALRLGAASLPLSDRFLVDRSNFLKG